YPPMTAISGPIDDNPPEGFLAAPGEYTVSLSKRVGGKTTELVAAQSFTVERLRKGALPGAPIAETVAFWERVAKMDQSVSAADQALSDVSSNLESLEFAIANTRSTPTTLDAQWSKLKAEVDAIEEMLFGNQSMAEVGQDPPPNIVSRLNKVATGVSNSAYGPTKTHRQTLAYAEQDFAVVRERLLKVQNEGIPSLEKAIVDAGGPPIGAGHIPAIGSRDR
ncbi:MAG: glycosyl hydrolase, partial [Pseudomonadota bacterium]